MTKSRGILAKRRHWDPKELAFVREMFSDMPTESIAILLGRSASCVGQTAYKMGLHKSAEYLASPAACRLRREASPASIAHRFKPGLVPFNKGLRRPGWGPGRMKETQFKDGERRGAAAKNWQPLGTILTDGDGYRRIKIGNGVKGEAYGFGNTKIWPMLHRHVWEQHHGPIPASHAVVFKDGDRGNCDIGNLECISRRDLLQRNSVHRWGPEVFGVIQLRGVLNRKLRSIREKQDIGSAQSSV